MQRNKLIYILFLVLIGYTIYLQLRVSHSVPGVSFKAFQDSLKAHDKVRDSTIDAIQDKYQELSIEKGRIKADIGKIPNDIHIIKKHYDKKKHDLITLPVDKQFEFFSKHLPKEDSTGK